MGLFDMFRKDKKDDVTKELEQINRRQQQTTTAAEGSLDYAGEAGVLVVDDVFTITGRGTVVTGTVAAGSFQLGDSVQIVHDGHGTLTTTIQGIEAFRQLLSSANKGDQVGILLQGVDRQDIGKGYAIRKI